MKQQTAAGGCSRSSIVDGWQLTPEGAAIHRDERVAVIADVHLGYEWARGAGGDCVPAHSLGETQRKIDRLLRCSQIDRLVVAGDLVESHRPCGRTATDLSRLVLWLSERGVRLTLTAGNHDLSVAGMLRVRPLATLADPPVVTGHILVAGWTVTHGDRRISAERIISGHHHPVLRVSGHSAPCFLVGEGRIVLPAFSNNAAGLDVGSARLPGGWSPGPLRCLVSTGRDLLDFGPLKSLQARMR